MERDVLARFPGPVHDSRIWKISGAGMYVENTFSMGEHILGDSGYLLRPYLLTPHRQPTSTPQSNYSYAHRRTRLNIEQTFGRWKIQIRRMQAGKSGLCLYDKNGLPFQIKGV